MLMEAPEVIGEVRRYWEALYTKRPVNLSLDLASQRMPGDIMGGWRGACAKQCGQSEARTGHCPKGC